MNKITSMQKRPEAEARKVGAAQRTRYTKQLRVTLNRALGWHVYSARRDQWNMAYRDGRGPQIWSSVRIRPEVAIALKELQQNYLANTGKEIAQSEVVAALTAVGISDLLNTEEFAPA